jgi:hypothetical protein
MTEVDEIRRTLRSINTKLSAAIALNIAILLAAIGPYVARLFTGHGS